MSGKKSEDPRRKYDDEFKRDVLGMLSGGRSVQDIAQSLGINTNMVHRWRAEQNASDGVVKPMSDAVSADVQEQIMNVLKHVYGK